MVAHSERKGEDMSAFVPEKQPQAQALSLLLAQRVREYFKCPKHRAEFEAWFLKKNGYPYEWKKVGGK